MLFWIIAVSLAALSGGTILLALLRQDQEASPATQDISVYRDQLAEVERDLERGTLSPAEAELTRTEIARRILAADQSAQPALSLHYTGKPLAAVVILAIAAAALALYARLGAPGYPDIPLTERIAASDLMRANRPSQAEIEAGIPPLPPADLSQEERDLIAQLRQVVLANPESRQGWEFLVGVERDLGDYAAAARAQAEVVRLRGSAATLDDFTSQLDLMVAATRGAVSPEAEALLRHILSLDKENVAARYYLGLLYAQTDRADIAYRLWRGIIDQAPADNPHVALARNQVEEAAFRAGVDYELPATRGPSADDIASAADMSAEDRTAMIEGMVGQLGERLATEGGPPEDWSRLISSLGVLGELDKARAIWTEAQTTFANSPSALEQINQAAASAGLTQ